MGARKALLKYADLLRFIVFTSLFVASAFSLFATRWFALENVCAQLTEPRRHKPNAYEPSMIQVKYDDTEDENFDLYRDLFSTYVYNNSVDRDAIVTDEVVPFEVMNAEVGELIGDYSASIVSQFVYNEVETKDTSINKYILRHGRFALYLPITIECGHADDFMYISDVVADCWIHKIGMETLEISEYDDKAVQYNKLISFFDSKGCFLVYKNSKDITFRIANVYYSDFGYSLRTRELHGEIVLSHALCAKNLANFFEYHYELETHIDTFGNKRILKLVNQRYGANAKVSFYTPLYDGSKIPVYNKRLTNEYKAIMESKPVYFGYLLSTFFYILFIAFQLTMKRIPFQTIPSCCLFGCFYLIYGLISTFIYLFSGFGVALLIYTATFLIINGKEAVNDIFKRKKTSFTNAGNVVFYQIDI